MAVNGANGDVVAGVVAGCAVVVGVLVGAGGRGATVRAAGAAACLVARFSRGLGAVTLTGGSGVCGRVSGGVGGGAGSGVVCGGGSGVVGGVCDAATPASEINTSA